MNDRVWLAAGLILVLAAPAPAAPPAWPDDVREVRYPCSGDHSEQPALFWKPTASTGKRPLLVGVHTWSSDYRQATSVPYLRWCQQQGWVFIHPNFRGQNWTPTAMGSDLAVADMVSAVEYAKRQAAVDPDRIYLIGASGGGHMSLLLAGRHPEIWAGVSAWVPINDIAAWYDECRANSKFANYAQHIEKVLGGPPREDAARAAAARRRSPSAWLAGAKQVPLDINAGVHDGRTGSVPFRHSLLAFNAVAAAGDRLAPAEIAAFYATETRPAAWPAPADDPLYGHWKPLVRKTSGNARVTIFEGGHEIVQVAALNWLAQQRRGRPAVWEVRNPVKLQTTAKSVQSGK
jgi:dienelactone hydrolase